ncbi:MAG: TetR/AcrR family transcriptional regulator [Firmicutes bacterium]|nr:TetR/AcrR family transcriptional regulator [Bacillota bacterium]
MHPKLSTGDKILYASADLFSKYGYKAVTTKQIAAAASVNEVTLFRHFGTKKNIFEETLNKFVFKDGVRKIFEEGIVWDLEKDLFFMSKAYNKIMDKNRKMFLILIKEFNILESSKNPFIKFPRKLKEFLTEYFLEMQKGGKVRKDNPEAQAVSFLLVNLGALMSGIIANNILTEISFEDYLSHAVAIFIRGLKP